MKRTIDITPKRPTTDFRLERNKERILQDLPDFAEKQAKHEADKGLKIDWKPTFSRIKIKPDPETISGIVDIANGREVLTRGVIVELGPEVGKRDGVEVETFFVGQRVLYISNHPMVYTGANGITHHFLKENSDVTSIIAVERRQPTVNVGDVFEVTGNVSYDKAGEIVSTMQTRQSVHKKSKN